MAYTPRYGFFFPEGSVPYPQAEHENIVQLADRALGGLVIPMGPGFATALDYQPSIVAGTLGVNAGRTGGGTSFAFVGDDDAIVVVAQDVQELVGPGNADGVVTPSTLNYFFLKLDGTWHIDTDNSNPGNGAQLAFTATFDTDDATVVDGNPVGRINVEESFPGKSRVSAAAEAANARVISIFATNGNGRDYLGNAQLNVWLSDAQYGAPTGTVPDGGIALSGGIGAIKRVIETAKELQVITRASDGQVALAVTHSGVRTWYVNVERAGRITSIPLAFV